MSISVCQESNQQNLFNIIVMDKIALSASVHDTQRQLLGIPPSFLFILFAGSIGLVGVLASTGILESILCKIVMILISKFIMMALVSYLRYIFLANGLHNHILK